MQSCMPFVLKLLLLLQARRAGAGALAGRFCSDIPRPVICFEMCRRRWLFHCLTAFWRPFCFDRTGSRDILAGDVRF